MMNHWHPVEGYLFPQGSLTELALPAVDVFLAALTDPRPPFALAWILEALRFAVLSTSSESGREDECRRRVSRGLWLFVAMAQDQPPAVRVSAIEVIEAIDPALAALVESSEGRQQRGS